jgi:hypothetical protein
VFVASLIASAMWCYVFIPKIWNLIFWGDLCIMN